MVAGVFEKFNQNLDFYLHIFHVFFTGVVLLEFEFQIDLIGLLLDWIALKLELPTKEKIDLISLWVPQLLL